MKTIIYSGGTFSYVRNHMALSAPAFGGSGRLLKTIIPNSTLVLTKMADSTSNIITNEDLLKDLTERLKDEEIQCIIMNAALCDFDGIIDDIPSGKHSKRLETRSETPLMKLTPANKVISSIKTIRPDILVVGFKTTCNQEEMLVEKAQRMLDSADIVIANDTGARINYIVTDRFISRQFTSREALFEELYCTIDKLLTKPSIMEASNWLWY